MKGKGTDYNYPRQQVQRAESRRDTECRHPTVLSRRPDRATLCGRFGTTHQVSCSSGRCTCAFGARVFTGLHHTQSGGLALLEAELIPYGPLPLTSITLLDCLVPKVPNTLKHCCQTERAMDLPPRAEGKGLTSPWVKCILHWLSALMKLCVPGNSSPGLIA